jgi:RNA polymerase sigma-70 factor (ECF subfamily)
MSSPTTACQDGDLPGLVALLADDIVLRADGGGKVHAAIRPVQGASNVARFILGILKKASPGTIYRPATINNQPGFIAWAEGKPYAVLSLDIADGQIRSIANVANPDKLRKVREGTDAAG